MNYINISGLKNKILNINSDNKTYGSFDLHWPPIDDDYNKIFKEANNKNYIWKEILVYVKNNLEMLIFDPINKSKEYSKIFIISNELGKIISKRVILLEFM